MVRPKKHLGQHFLKDKNIAEKIVNSLISKNPSYIIEVGPGTGILTQFLIANKDTDLRLIEIDRESVEYLKENFPELNSKITEADFLSLKSDFFCKPYSIIGNFPYNISSQIFFKIIENRDFAQHVVCMIQKEVAERIASAPGNKVYGILSVLLQAFFIIEYLFTVNESVFIPPPKVKSAVIRLTRNSVNQLDCNEELFFKVVKTTFNQRRKTIRNSIKPISGAAVLSDPIFDKRPEQLCVQEFIMLTKQIEKVIF